MSCDYPRNGTSLHRSAPLLAIERASYGSSKCRNLIDAGLRILLAALTVSYCGGCIILPMRAPSRTKGASAVTREKVNLDFIQKGVTTRQEVLQKLSWMDTGVRDDRLFVGRWIHSRWGVFWAAAGYVGANAGWNRNWNRSNLIVQFDGSGIVEQYKIVSDKDLSKELSATVAQGLDTPLDMSTPIEVPAKLAPRAAKNPDITDLLVLGNESLEYREVGGKGKRDFVIPANQIASLSLGYMLAESGSEPDPHLLFLTLHFAKKTKMGKKLTVQADMSTVVLLFKYYSQIHSKPAT